MNLFIKTCLYISTMVMSLFFVVTVIETAMFPTWFILIFYAIWMLSFVSTFTTKE